MTILSIVVPCYDEEDVLPETSRRLAGLIDDLIAERLLDAGSAIYFVDDGSRDRTWDLICDLHKARPERFHGIKLSRNRGHQNALLAGLRHAPGDAIISMDADLQDDPMVIPDMIRRFQAGCDIVYGVRRARDSDTRFKRWTARRYYRLLTGLGVDIVPDHADFRLMSRRVITAMAGYGEVNLFVRAIVPLLGFRTDKVFYDRPSRFAGESKYPLVRMVTLALDGITSFSMQPLRLITGIGITVSVIAFLVGFWAIYIAFVSPRAVPGWASVVVPVSFIGGLQLLCLGIVGEYIGKIYLETKRRPIFEIEETI
jgi:glycosyltransferase involved in cell wall biosynthesis